MVDANKIEFFIPRPIYISRITFTTLLAVLILALNGQQIIDGDKVARIELHDYAVVYTDTSSQINVSKVLDEDRVWSSFPENGFTKRSSPNSYWIKFILSTGTNSRFILELNEMTLDEVILWKGDGSGFVQLGRVNKSEEFNIANSDFRLPTIEFELEENSITTLYLYVDDFQGPIACPINLFNPKSYASYNRIAENMIGMQFGIFICLLILTIVTWVYFKDFIYLLYAVHLVGVILFQLHESGLLLKYFWSFDPDITKYTRYFSSILYIISLGLIVKYFLKTKEILPKLDRILVGFIVFIILSYVVLSALIILTSFNISAVINAVIIVVILFPVFIVVICIAAYRKTKSLNPLYIILLFAMSILYTIIHPLLAYGIMDVSYKNYLSWLGPLEGFMLFGVLLKELYKSRELKIKYQEELIAERAENVNQFMSGQESERKRISQALHDGVNSRLASLKVLVSNGDSSQKNAIVKNLDSIGFDVRSISHAIDPHTLRFHGLKGAIEEEIYKIESNNVNIQFTFQYDKNVDSLQKGYIEILYYAALELLQNTLKHSAASEVKISITIDDQEVLLNYYDNGELIDSENVIPGLGLKNIASNAKLYNGSFVISRDGGQNLQRLTLLKSYT